MWNIKMQLHGGGGGSSTPDVKTSAPGSTAAATLDSATTGERENMRKKLSSAKGRQYTDKTNGGVSDVAQAVKKMLLGE